MSAILLHTGKQYFAKCITWAKENGEDSCHIHLLEQMQSRATTLEMYALTQWKITDFFLKI